MSVAYSFDLKIQKKIHEKLMKDIDFVEGQKHSLEKEILEMKNKIDQVIYWPLSCSFHLHIH